MITKQHFTEIRDQVFDYFVKTHGYQKFLESQVIVGRTYNQENPEISGEYRHGTKIINIFLELFDQLYTKDIVVPYIKASLYHELIHAWQVNRGSLSHDHAFFYWYDTNSVIKRIFKVNKIAPFKINWKSSNLNDPLIYYNLPWEIEAYCREYIYLNSMINYKITPSDKFRYDLIRKNLKYYH